MREKVLVALIAAGSAVIVALIGILPVKGIARETAQDEARRTVFVSGVPLGTVVPSMLAPEAFAQLVGDDGTYNPSTATWVPADGRDVPGSRYARELHSTRVPDVRGLFIRSLNYTERGRDRLRENAAGKSSADPDSSRQPGDFQADRFSGQIDADPVSVAAPNSASVATQSRPGSLLMVAPETRPKNIAMFHYIKIN